MGGEGTPIRNPQYSLGGWGIPPSNHKTKQMNSLAIVSGNFSAGEGAQGNYTGYTALGKKVFIFKRQMNALGFTTDSEVKFPFYAVTSVKKIGKLDKNRQPILDEAGNAVTEDRLQATALFETKDAIVNACIDEATLDADIKDGIAKHATSKGLSQSLVDSLVAAF